MKKLAKLGIVTGALLACAGAQAEIYKSIDRQGKVSYSDQPAKNAKPVDLPSVNYIPTAESPKLASKAADPDIAGQDTAVAYKSVRIVAPEDDTGIGHGPGNFTVQARTTPELQQQHGLRLFMDGAAYGAVSTSGTFALTNVDRGTHQLAVKVIDASGKTLKTSKPVTVHVFRPSVAMPAY